MNLLPKLPWHARFARVRASLTPITLLCALIAAAETRAQAPPQREKADAVCEVSEPVRSPLQVEDGRLLYADAGAFEPSNGEILLAGAPSWLTGFNAAGDKVVSSTADSVFGAVIPPSGRARLVPSPIDARFLGGVRAVPREGGGWSVVFAELQPFSGSVRDTVSKLWYGVYDGRQWTDLEQLPLPTGGTLGILFASSLVQAGDTLWWAMTLHTPAGPRIALFERRAGRWSHEVVPTFQAHSELGYSPTLGPLLLVVQPDSTLRSDGNSLIIWARRPGWTRLSRAVLGSVEGRVYSPGFSRSPAGSVLTWVGPPPDGPPPQPWHARAMIRPADDQNGPIMTIDSSAVFSSDPVHVPIGNATGLWVTHHGLPSGNEHEIRIAALRDGHPAVVRSFPSPYFGFMAAAAPGPAELVVTGLHYNDTSYYFVSILFRMTVACTGATAEATKRP